MMRVDGVHLELKLFRRLVQYFNSVALTSSSDSVSMTSVMMFITAAVGDNVW